MSKAAFPAPRPRAGCPGKLEEVPHVKMHHLPTRLQGGSKKYLLVLFFLGNFFFMLGPPTLWKNHFSCQNFTTVAPHCPHSTELLPLNLDFSSIIYSPKILLKINRNRRGKNTIRPRLLADVLGMLASRKGTGGWGSLLCPFRRLCRISEDLENTPLRTSPLFHPFNRCPLNKKICQACCWAPQPQR